MSNKLHFRRFKKEQKDKLLSFIKSIKCQTVFILDASKKSKKISDFLLGAFKKYK